MNEALKEEMVEKILMFGNRAIEDWKNEDVAALTPQRTDNYLSVLSAYSATLEEEHGNAIFNGAVRWLELREDSKTNKSTDQEYLASPEGKLELDLKKLLKAVDKIIAACKKRMDRFNREAYNQG